MARLILSLPQGEVSADEIMFKANDCLAKGYYMKALRLYTKILYETCPGYICALLNRALAYIALGYPELGVADAHRASLLAQDWRSLYEGNTLNVTKGSRAEATVRAIAKYVRSERQHVENGAPWTSTPRCYISSGWLHSPLASIVLISRGDDRTQSAIPWIGFELRATYRMCGALWQCGGGALSDALGMVDDVQAKGKYPLTLDETVCFNSLGDLIIDDVSNRFTLDPTRFYAQMKMKVTLVSRVIYPWNTHERNVKSFKETEELECYADEAAKACEVRFVPPTLNSGACFSLIAARGIYDHETVLSEGSLLQVMTVCSEGVKGYFCDVCAAMIVTAEEDRTKALSQKNESWSTQVSVQSRSISLAGSDMDCTPQGPTSVNDSFYHYPIGITSVINKTVKDERSSEGPEVSLRSSSTDREISENPRKLSPKASNASDQGDGNSQPDFLYCHDCLQVPYCSSECFLKSNDYHCYLCTTEVEEDIRLACRFSLNMLSRSNDNEASDRLFIHPNAQCLYDLLLVRILAIAAYKDMNPLDLKEIRWLNGDLRSCPPIDEKEGGFSQLGHDYQLYPSSPSVCPTENTNKLLPWTFTNNVVRPTAYMRSMGFDRGLVHLKDYDGWIINTLYAKIMHSTHISEGVRKAKIYDDHGKLVSESTSTAWSLDKDIWVGSLHTALAMVGTADEAAGEKANVSLRDESVVKCYPVTRDNVDVEMEDDEEVTMEIDDSDEETAAVRMSPGERRKACIEAGEAIVRVKEWRGAAEP